MWVMPAVRIILALGGAAGVFKGLDNLSAAPGKVLKDNALPLAIVAAGTFLALQAMKKAKVA